MTIAPRNRVLFALSLGAIAACLASGFVSEAANRLVSGKALLLWRVAGAPMTLTIAVLAASLLALSLAKATRTMLLAELVLAGALLLLLCYDSGAVASSLMANLRPVARISLGPAFWIAGFCLAMIVLDALQRLDLGAAMRLVAVVAIAAPVAWMAASGALAELSILREYAARESVFAAELARHCVLVSASVGGALGIGVPLGILAARRPAAKPAIFAALNLLQTIPSIAMFGLLILPLSAIAAAIPALGAVGIGGIGPAPAIVALVLYSLLPVARNTHAGIVGVEPSVVESALGMGFTGAQVLWRVELVLGMPTFLAGLRIVLVQAIGLACVAALIGAGGLGSFIFQGIGQYATDLVLLGAIPAILLALAADFAVALIASIFERKIAP